MSRVSLVVRNIGWTCTKHDLRRYLKKFGTTQQVHIPMNYETGFNRKHAFVKMLGTPGFADSILQDYHVIDGNEVTVELQTRNRRQQNDTQKENVSSEVVK